MAAKDPTPCPGGGRLRPARIKDEGERGKAGIFVQREKDVACMAVLSRFHHLAGAKLDNDGQCQPDMGDAGGEGMFA
ncbi:MAG: hypothetical protein R3D84_01025 [Paracoccaceae bacterium]